MRPVEQLVHARTRVRQRYAVMPLEGFPASRLPNWPDAEVKVLASPALGARFVQYLIDVPANKRGGFPADPEVETFHYLLSGGGVFVDSEGTKATVADGAYGLTPPGRGATFHAGSDGIRLIVLRKHYERAPGIKLFEGFYGSESGVKKAVWAGNSHSLLQALIPDELQYDMAMNIFTFDPGFGLPMVETHVMEHGLYFLEGKGLYLLGEEWMEVEKDDFIWMGPYCPQSFYATGPTPARYIYYKNVNRDIPV
jgi:(S)-ureidoglycine aminohydrolase